MCSEIKKKHGNLYPPPPPPQANFKIFLGVTRHHLALSDYKSKYIAHGSWRQAPKYACKDSRVMLCCCHCAHVLSSCTLIFFVIPDRDCQTNMIISFHTRMTKILCILPLGFLRISNLSRITSFYASFVCVRRA